MKRNLVIGVPLAVALLAGGAFLLGGQPDADATHGKKGYVVPGKGGPGDGRAAVLKRAFADLKRLEAWVEHACRFDCGRASESVESLRADLERLRMLDTTKHAYRPSPMNGVAFAALLRAVRESTYESRRMEILRVEARTAWFTAAQVRRLLEELAYESWRLEALEVLAPRLVDPENRIVILSAFEYESSKSRAHELCGHGTPASVVVPW